MIKVLPPTWGYGSLAVLALALAVPSTLSARPQAVEQRSERAAVSQVKQLNPTTYEVYFSDGRILTIDFYTNDIIRLFLDPQGGVVRAPKASPEAQILVDNPRKQIAPIEREETKTQVRLRSASGLRLDIDRISGLLSLVDAGGHVLVRQLEPLTIAKGATTLRLSSTPAEYYYGGGVQNGRFSHRGKAIDIVNTNNWVDGGVASPTPFYWSTAGYGLMWHTFRPGRYDFDTKAQGRVELTHQEEYLDVFLMAAPTPTGLLQQFYQITGKPVLMPKFGFYQGHLNAYNRDYWQVTTDTKRGIRFPDGKYYTESQKDNGGVKESLNGERGNYQFSARAALDRYLQNDMPLGWFLPNDGYGAGYGQTESLEGNVENLRLFGEYARKQGVEIGLWTQSDLHPKPGISPLLQRDIVKEVRDAGVRVLKTDVAWVGAGYSFGLNGVADVAQIMPYYGQAARPFIISLDGWAGTQRYATIWSGDQTGGEWEYIRFHIPTFIGSGLSGQPNITSDVDGIFGGKNSAVNIREFQWKTFTPMELNMDGWGSNPKFPDALGEPATSINRWYLKMKSMLMPYAYTIAREAVDGKPMIRAMMLEYPNDFTLGTATRYQYLYGRDFLIAPIYQPTRIDAEGNDVRHGIYLPEGTLWYDYFTGEAYAGGRIINDYAAPIWKLPIFVRAGAIIPVTIPHNTPNEQPRDYRAYELYPAQGTHMSQEYDDDGRSEAYRLGADKRTALRMNLDGTHLTFSIGPSEGKGFSGYEPRKRTEVRINVSEEPGKVSCQAGGRRVALRRATSLADYEASENVYYYDAAPELNKFATEGTPFAHVSIRRNPQLLVKLAAIDADKQEVVLSVRGVRFDVASSLLKKSGALTAPQALHVAEAKSTDLMLGWEPVDNADYYEIRFEDRIYSTIRTNSLRFEDLRPDMPYTFELRAVNRDGASEWTSLGAKTSVDPLLWAIKGISGVTSCANQGGTPVSALFDHDDKSMWHTAWSQKAVPFTLDVDLRALYEVDTIRYVPRDDAGNGTLLRGTLSYSTDKINWSKPVAWTWARNAMAKDIVLPEADRVRYLRFEVAEATGNFGSGRELLVFRRPGTEALLQGDINKDKRIDENDLTSYMNYTGLRRSDADFDYVSAGDINSNGLIDAYDIAHVAVSLNGGAQPTSGDKVQGKLLLKPSAQQFRAGDEIAIAVHGSQDMQAVNAMSFALPYDATLYEYLGTSVSGAKTMENLTYDRLHSNGTKALYPTFVNLGQAATLSGDGELFVIRLRAKRAGKFNLSMLDGILVDRALGSVRWP
ncbi:MAG: glycoside hydrolase family 31 protein [Porphyromonas sp.]|nr:glycoside hydrolase family 31 protein [Porphyromonas sp.]